MPFQYSLNSSTIKPVPILDKIRIAGEVGYAGIELWHDDIDAFVAGGGSLQDIRKALVDHALAVPTTIHLKGWFESTGEEHARAIHEFQRKLDIAAELGAVHVVAGPPHGRADRELGAKNYVELLEAGLAVGVKPAIEYLGFVEEFKTIEDAVDLLRRAGHPEGTIVHDPFHIFRGGGSIESVATLNPREIAIWHFNDAPADPPREQQRDPDRVMPGEGIIDLKRLCDLLRQIGYEGFLSLELFREDLWQQNPREVARIGLEKMRAVAEGC